MKKTIKPTDTRMYVNFIILIKVVFINRYYFFRKEEKRTIIKKKINENKTVATVRQV